MSIPETPTTGTFLSSCISDLVHAQGGYYSDALHAVLSEGHEAVAQLLLEKAAEYVPPLSISHTAYSRLTTVKK